MKNIPISVLMSVSDDSCALQESISSVLDQDFENFEFIIIHDGTSEKISTLLSKYTDDRIVLISNGTNLGLTASLNKGLAIAQGEYIARIDAGDICLPHRLRVQQEYLKTRPEIFLAGGNCVYITSTGEELFASYLPQKSETIARLIKKKNMIIHSTIMFRNSGALKYREKFFYAQDYDLYLRLISSGKMISNMDDILIKYRLDTGSISFAKRKLQMLFAGKAREFYHQRTNSDKDNYDVFDPNTVLNAPLPYEDELAITGRAIQDAFEICDTKTVRSLYTDYKRNRKLPDKYLFYFLFSFLPLPAILFARRFVSRMKNYWYVLQK